MVNSMTYSNTFLYNQNFYSDLTSDSLFVPKQLLLSLLDTV